LAIIDAIALMRYDQQAIALPTEGGDGAKEQPDRRRGRKQEGEQEKKDKTKVFDFTVNRVNNFTSTCDVVTLVL
jgi:hypothetical protein